MEMAYGVAASQTTRQPSMQPPHRAREVGLSHRISPLRIRENNNPPQQCDELSTGGSRTKSHTVNCGGPIMVALNFYLYGDQATATVARETPQWEAWFQKRFPTPT
jgi:hypothetical protein